MKYQILKQIHIQTIWAWWTPTGTPPRYTLVFSLVMSAFLQITKRNSVLILTSFNIYIINSTKMRHRIEQICFGKNKKFLLCLVNHTLKWRTYDTYLPITGASTPKPTSVVIFRLVGNCNWLNILSVNNKNERLKLHKTFDMFNQLYLEVFHWMF